MDGSPTTCLAYYNMPWLGSTFFGFKVFPKCFQHPIKQHKAFLYVYKFYQLMK